MGKGKRNRIERKDVYNQLAERGMRRAITRATNQTMAEANDRFYKDEASVILYVLYTVFGFTEEQLIKFMSAYRPACQELRDYYLEDEEGTSWLAKKYMENNGFDMNNIMGIVDNMKDL